MMRALKTIFIVIGFVVIALGVALYTPDLPPEELRARYASPASQFVVLPSGATVHLRDEGNPDGPPLLLIHGSNASLHTWEGWVALLGDDYRVISLDLPGHGLTGGIPSEDYSQASMDAFTLEVMDALGVARFAVAGNSMGGGVAWRLALRAPERISHLILVDAGGVEPAEPRQRPLAFRLASTPVVNQILRHGAPVAIYRSGLRASFYDESLVTEDMVMRYYDLARHPGNRTATIARFSAPPDLSLQPRLSEISQPTLILWGEEDVVTPLSMLAVFEAAMPHAEIITYPEVGHLPQEEAAEQSAADVRAFLARHGHGGAVDDADEMDDEATAGEGEETEEEGEEAAGDDAE